MTLTATSVPSSSTALCTCRRAPPPAGRRPPDAADVKGGSRTLVAVAPSPWSPSRDTATEHAATSMLAFLSRDTAKSEKPADTAGTGAGTGVLRQAAGQNLGERGGGDGRLVEAGEERLGAGHSRSPHVTRGVTVSRPQGTQVPTTSDYPHNRHARHCACVAATCRCCRRAINVPNTAMWPSTYGTRAGPASYLPSSWVSTESISANCRCGASSVSTRSTSTYSLGIPLSPHPPCREATNCAACNTHRLKNAGGAAAASTGTLM